MYFYIYIALLIFFVSCHKLLSVCVGAGAGQPGDGGALAIPADRAVAQAEGEEG